MIIKIKNLGAVHQADVEIKPLTVFVGPNNTGKTWTTYALAAIFGPEGWSRYTHAYAAGELTDSYPPLESIIKQLLEEGNAKIDLIQFFNDFGSKYFNNVANFSPNWMQWFMGTKQVTFSNLEICVEIQNMRDNILREIQAFQLDAKLSVGEKSDALLNASKKQGESMFYFFTTTENSIQDKFPIRVISEFVVRNVFMIFHRSINVDLYFFPAERTAFTLLASSGKFTKEAERDMLPKEESESVLIPSPLGNFIRLIENLHKKGSFSARLEQAKKEDEIRKFLELAEIAQQDILGGKLDYLNPEPKPPRELLFELSMDKKIILDMSAVSSMVKGLSMLVLYLRYIAKPRDLLVIDEPEMNLHPEAQVMFTEFLAMIVNAGLNVLVTTHSPYLVDHLVNLMKAAKREDTERIKDRFYLKRTDAFIKQNDVSVYLFENNTAKNILDEDGFIDWDTFSRVSERISNLYFEI